MIGIGPLEWASIGVLTIWTIASIVFKFTGKRVRFFSLPALLGILLRGTFFTPHPGKYVYHLLYRDHLTDGTVLAWKEVRMGEKRRWWSALWNPRRREWKALIIVVANILESPTASTEFSAAYLALLHYVTDLPHAQMTSAIQFLAISSQEGHSKEPPVLFHSEQHAYDAMG